MANTGTGIDECRYIALVGRGIIGTDEYGHRHW